MTLNPYSSTLTAKHAHGTARAVLHATGLTPEDLAKPQDSRRPEYWSTRL